MPTLRALNRKRYLGLCQEYNRSKQRLTTAEEQQRFIMLSIGLHAAKGLDGIPKAWTRPSFVARVR